MGKAILEGIRPPAMLIDRLLYAGQTHSFFGLPGSGKSIVAMWKALQVMQSGKPVIYLDAENGARRQAARLRDMGADPEMLDDLMHFIPSPRLTLEKDSLEDLHAEAARIAPALTIFDSWADYLSMCGLSENDSMDITNWHLKTCVPLLQMGSSVVLLDHTTKDGGSYRGSGAKLAALDAAHEVKVKEPFDRDRMGAVRLSFEKDRDGFLDRRITFEIGGDGCGNLFCDRREWVENTEVDNLTERDAKALDTLTPAGDEGYSYGEWRAATGLSQSTFDRARKQLINTDRVVCDDGKYRVV